MTNALNVCVPSALDPADSFGQIGIEAARHLHRAGFRVNLFSLGPRAVAMQDAETRSLVEQPIAPIFGSLKAGYPTTFNDHPALTQFGPQLGLVMWESTVPPAQFVAPMNDLDAVITPCHFCKEVFERAGVTTPIHVVPLGQNAAYAPRERSTDGPPSSSTPSIPAGTRGILGPLTFISFIDRGLRKGGIEALRAFQAAFGDSTDVRLILKGRKSKINASILNPNVELIQEDYTVAQMVDLYHRADVMIFSTKGEGWGWPPREAAACGVTSLATNFAGTADDIDAWGIPLDYELVRADWSGHNRLSKMELGEWAEVDFDALVARLRDIADNREQYAADALRKAPGVQAMYSWERFAGRVAAIWEGVQ
jgi:glycosyltransferase involved in cell wall biosynthesis